MTRSAIGFGLAAALSMAVSLGAQTTPQTHPDNDNVSVTGCLQRDATGGYILSNAQIDRNESGATTTGTTGTTGTTTTSGTTTAGATAEAGAAGAGSTWKLEGSSSDLDRHVGHKVTVTGHEKSMSSSAGTSTGTTTGTTATTTGTTGTTGTTMTGQEHQRSASSHPDRLLDVKSVKMISSSCS